MLSADEMAHLAKRCLAAVTHKWKIAGAEHFAKELGYREGDTLPPKVKKFSAAHLLHLIDLLGPNSAPKSSAAKFAKVGKAKKAAIKDEDQPVTRDDLPTVRVDPMAVRAAADAMRKSDEET
jgi:hypothetical protein